MADYFSLFGLEPAYSINVSALEKSYFNAQRQFHPDRFVGKSEIDKLAAAKRSMDINQAYKTLKDPLPRAQYLLKLNDVIVGTDNDSIKPSQALLAEVMELRETPPEAKILEALVDRCIARIQTLSETKDWPAMADETLRLGYLLKVHH